MKLLTLTAALEALGPDHRFSTRVVGTRRPRGSCSSAEATRCWAAHRRRTPPRTRRRRDLALLDGQGAARGRAHQVRLGYDASLFTGPSDNPRWEPSYVGEDVSAVSRCGSTRAGSAASGPLDPAAAAAAVRRRPRADRREGRRGPHPSRAPTEAAGGMTMATVRSSPLAQVVQHVLEASDNDGAEVLSVRPRSAPAGGPSRGCAAVEDLLAQLGVTLRGPGSTTAAGCPPGRLAPRRCSA